MRLHLRILVVTALLHLGFIGNHGCFAFIGNNGFGHRRNIICSSMRHNKNNHGSGNKEPPSQPPLNWNDGGAYQDGDDSTLVASSFSTWNETEIEFDDSGRTRKYDYHGSTLSTIRGGNKGGGSNTNIVKGAKVSLEQAVNFWKSTFSGAKKKLSSMFQSKQAKEEAELMKKLTTMPVRAVTVPNSTVLPPDVVRLAVKRSGLLGNPLRTDNVQEIARSLKRWYMAKGYILHSVTGATFNPDSATAKIDLQEPKVSDKPVEITVCKQMVIDEGEIMTFKQYRSKHLARKTFRHDRMDPKDLNTTFVETNGRTKNSRIAKALQLSPGTSFRWDGTRWQKIARSGIFSKVLKVSPQGMPDGTVQLQVIAVEPPPRHLEYGLAKSLYTGSWEGEIDFENKNLFGGGETLGLTVRRGTKDTEPSIRVSFSDDKFGLEGGYSVDVFSEYIGNEEKVDEKKEGGKAEDGQTAIAGIEYDNDSLLDRRGATFRVRNPFSPDRIRNSVASASIERTSTRNGLHESIGSATMTLGPFRKMLPMDARTDIASTVTTGSRFTIGETDEGSSDSILSCVQFLPYTSFSATTRQILPLSSLSSEGSPPLVLALQHTVASSTQHLPRHKANAMSIAARIRGASPDGRTSTSVKGTTELRVPLKLPLVGDASTVLFGDWFFCQRTDKSPFYSKSSIGVGIRKNVQGLPLKYDMCYSSEGKMKAMFGLGPDFDI